MSKNTPDDNESIEPRTRRALEQYLTVLPEAPGLFEVVSQSGSAYTVDAREGRCTCPDAEYNLGPNETCKHERRVAFATGERPIPAGVEVDAIDELLGRHVDGAPRVVATDGGVIDAGDEGEILDEEDGDGRPDRCGCWSEDVDLPCFPCFRAGFRTPNPDTPGARE